MSICHKVRLSSPLNKYGRGRLTVICGKKVKVKSPYEPKWLIMPELIPVSVALSD